MCKLPSLSSGMSAGQEELSGKLAKNCSLIGVDIPLWGSTPFMVISYLDCNAE
jgi:hypothetical protein